jgi:uncharacterized protein YhjY with autotransporter beta-barrel domain
MNLNMGRAFLLSFLGVAGMSILTVHAQVILTGPANGLYNTGVDNSGAALAPGVQDPHYTLTIFNNTGFSTPATSTPGQPSYVANPPAGQWVANSGTSQWITYSPTTTFAATTASFNYHLVLNAIPVGRLVTLGGSVAADDNATISANGHAPSFSNYTAVAPVGSNFNSFNTIPDFSFISAASNYLDILVFNNGAANTGLDLELNGSYSETIIQFDVPNLTNNQQAVLDYINQINLVGTDNACFGNLVVALTGLTGSAFGDAMDQLSPEKLNIFSSIAFNNATFMTQNLDDYLAHRRNQDGYFQVNPDFIDASGLTINDPTTDPKLMQVHSRLHAWKPGAPNGSADPKSMVAPSMAKAPSTDRWNVFIQGDVVLGQDFSNMDLQHENSTTGSVMIGADYQFSKNLLAGAFFSYSHTDANLDNNGSSATVDSYSPGIYVSYAQDGWYGNGLASYGHNDYSEQRNINIISPAGAFIESPSGDPAGDQEVVDMDGGYDFHKGDWTFGPTLGFQYVHFGVDSFTETGGCSADLAVNSQSADSFRSRLGGHVSYEAKTSGLILTPFLDASWQHEFLDGERGITSSFSDIGLGQFTVYTPNPGRESALLATGLNIDIDRMTTVFVSYLAQVTPNYYFGQSVNAGVKLAF